jgi:hypothetical protein
MTKATKNTQAIKISNQDATDLVLSKINALAKDVMEIRDQLEVLQGIINSMRWPIHNIPTIDPWPVPPQPLQVWYKKS